MSESGGDADAFVAGRLSPRHQALAGLAGVAAIGASIHVAPGVPGVTGAMLAVIMLASAITDWRRFIIPDALSLAAAALAIIDIAAQNFGNDFLGVMIDAAIRATAMATLFQAFRLIYRWARGWDGMGLGDVKLAGVAGLWLQAHSLPIAVEVAALIGLAVAMIRLWRSGTRFDPLAKLPFGAFFAPTIWLGWLLERWHG